MSKFVTQTGIERLIGIVKSELNGKASATHTHTVSDISDLTATSTELNYMDGVTSNVQTQFDTKAPWQSVSVLTQSEYDAIETPVSTTLYLIKEV